MSDTPPDPPISREIGEQGGDQILDPIVNDPEIRPQSPGAVLDEISNSGHRSLGGLVQGKLLAANVQSLEFDVQSLRSKLENETQLRHEAELQLARINGTESGKLPQIVLGGIVAAIGAILLSIGLTYSESGELSFDLAPSVIGIVLLVIGYALPQWSRSKK